MKKLMTGLCALQLLPVAALAETGMDHHSHHHHHHGHGHAQHIHKTNAPIGVMGDHMHQKGDWMLSYRYMSMHMDGNRVGTDSISPDEIVTTFPNPSGMMPSNIRVVPTEMRMDMHMVGAMYAPADWLTLMAMGNYIYKEMDHITFDTGTGTNRIGTFTTASSGIGDTKVTGLIRLYHDSTHHIHMNAGLSLPTGSIEEEDDVLAPNTMRMRMRMPYAMQLGSGTYDALPGLTYTGTKDDWSWGAQYRGDIRLEDENDEGYALGDKHMLTGWGAYEWTNWLSTSVRFSCSTQSDISGRDANISAPVQTADPDNYGGEVIEAGFGAKFTIPKGVLKDQVFGVEMTAPLHRDLNGPQMETDWSLTFGWQKAF